MAVTVTFQYEPDEPDDDVTGMSGSEYDLLMDQLMQIGANNIKIGP